ncbi:E3 ubiquitin-protein ligase CCNB1IP1 [Aspergillus awamori]|uniref:E3 ubiquitin-protein ligase CCNB1IP1 n=1 Tax=Aspergillus awamori TaxID=105351 RepID=A0A401KLX2_ASPAW|nr:E3 ubiquitin-protein ligase CCNB1IP1 [Aspergillus awamori]
MSQSEQPSHSSTPRSFTSQTASAEDLLKSQTVGLVHLSDFRKRRAEVLEQKEREAHDKSLGRFTSRSATPSTGEVTDGNSTPRSEGPPKKKKKKPITKSKLSFGDDDEEEENDSTADVAATPRDSSIPRSASRTPADDSSAPSSRRITPNPNAPPPPKAMTKAALKAEAEARDALRKEFLAMQEAVKNTEILIPFIFFDGTNIPAGTVRVKKGDPVWLFLDRCRKVGAELGVGGNSGASKARKDNRREWARVSVDDLMLVKGEIIVPHHYELYYFIANSVPDFTKAGGLLFDYSNKPPPAPSTDDPLSRPESSQLEGADKDPSLTKVVDRRCCPACQTVLVNPDDAVATALNPTEDYKTSVLSGLDPNTIMECAGRALLFWTYQTTQEIFYQEFLAKTLTEKYTNLNTQLDKVVHNANSEISALQARISDMETAQDQLRKKNQELVDMYREKCKKFTQMTNLYNILKSRAMRSQMQTAATDTVSQALDSLTASRNNPTGLVPGHSESSRPPHTPMSRQLNVYPVNQEGVEQIHRHQRSGTGSSKGNKQKTDIAAMPPPSRPIDSRSKCIRSAWRNTATSNASRGSVTPFNWKNSTTARQYNATAFPS